MSDYKAGGLSEEMKATKEVQALCNEVKPAILTACGVDAFEVFTALRYREQVVAGMNYAVKIQITPVEGCIHVGIFRGLNNGEVQVLGVEKGKTKHDPINDIPLST